MAYRTLDPGVNPIRYEGSIDCKTNVLFHECSSKIMPTARK